MITFKIIAACGGVFYTAPHAASSIFSAALAGALRQTGGKDADSGGVTAIDTDGG